MANRTYVPELASRLAMADSDARTNVTNTGQGNGEPLDSDDDSMQTPGRNHSHFILHNQDETGMPHTMSEHSRPMTIPSTGAMDIDDDYEIGSDSIISDASTLRDFHPPIPPQNLSRATAVPAPVVRPRTNPDSEMDITNRPPPESGIAGLGLDFTLLTDDTVLDQPPVSYSDLQVRNVYHHSARYSQFPTIANDPSLSHLREISGLASWTVSSYKPSCGVAALLNPSTSTFWQSDGPQPHLLNIHFFKLVRIVKLRVYLDFELDESYTPTRLAFAAGTHEYDAVEFAEWRWEGTGPKGWVDVDLSQCGSDEEREREMVDDSDDEDEEAASIAGVLRCFFLQFRVLENHQNGKDTHIRGVQIFARDERVKASRRMPDQVEEDGVEKVRQGLEEADWMREPQLR